jgi:hypothetical protein
MFRKALECLDGLEAGRDILGNSLLLPDIG